MNRVIRRVSAIAAVSAALWPAAAVAQTADAWQFGASLWGWFPEISGQGTFDARRGRCGALADVVYMSLGKAQTNVRNGTIRGSQIPASAARPACRWTCSAGCATSTSRRA